MKILVIRTSAMGDVVHCLPVLTALRRGLPGCRIGWVIEESFAPLLAGHPDIDQLIVVRTRAWRRGLATAETGRQISAAIRAMRDFRADIALDLMGNHKGALLARLSGAKRRLGAARPNRREPSSSLWINQPVAVSSVHAVDRALDLLAPLQLPAAPVDFGGHHILSQAPTAATAWLAERRRPFVVIQAGAGWGNKTYPAQWWGEVAHQIENHCGLPSWVPIAPGEEHLASAVATASGGAVRIVDARSLAFLAAVLRRGRLVLGGDTGPIHLSQALGTPVLCVIGPTDPSRNGPYAAPRSVLWQRLPCSFCYKRFTEPKACLLSLAPSMVAQRAIELLTAESGK